MSFFLRNTAQEDKIIITSTQNVVLEVRNETSSDIPIGSLVYLSGYNTNNNMPLIGLSKASNISTTPCIGITQENISTNTNGFIKQIGKLTYDTSSLNFNIGENLYLGLNGELTNIQPSGTEIKSQIVGIMGYKDSDNGFIIVKISDSSIVQNINNDNLSNVNSNISTLQSNINVIENDITVLNGNISTLESNINVIENSLSNINLNGNVSTLESNINVIENDITVINSNISTLESNINVIENDITVLNGNVSTLESNINVIESNINVIENDISNINLNGNVSTLESNINVIENDITVLNENVSILESNINVIENDITVINGNISILESNINVIENDISNINLNGNFSILESNINVIENDIIVINGNISILESNINVIENDITVINSNISTLESNINVIENDITVINSNISTLESNINVIENDITVLNGNVSTLESNINVIENDISNINISFIDSNFTYDNSNLNLIPSGNINLNPINGNVFVNGVELTNINGGNSSGGDTISDSNIEIRSNLNNVNITADANVYIDSDYIHMSNHTIINNTITIKRKNYSISSGNTTVTLNLNDSSDYFFSMSDSANLTLNSPTNTLRIGQQGSIIFKMSGSNQNLTWESGGKWYFNSGIAPNLTDTDGVIDIYGYIIVENDKIVITDATNFQQY
jgi:predicted  nucleic acid-binding Zn-ribbon protein